jgi:N utilization substance protein B
MPRVDRCLARIAIWEMLSGTSSAEVAVQQAVQLAQELSTDGSANFLNGLLAKVKQRIEANAG